MVLLNNGLVYLPLDYFTSGLDITFGYDPNSTYGDDIRFYLRGVELQRDEPILDLNSRIMYPYRRIAESLGAAVDWNPSTSTASAILENKFDRFVIGSNEYNDNGLMKKMDEGVVPFIYNNRTYLPLRYIVEPLGFSIRWDGTTSSVYIE